MKTTLGIIVVLVLALGVWLSLRLGQTAPTSLGAPVASANYSCDAGKTISAQYFQGTDKPGQNGGPPQPGGAVKVALSDGRNLTLKQTISADGTRYSDGDPQAQQGQAGAESFVFWSKGNTALVLENNEEKSYLGCIKVADDPGSLSQVYSSGAQGFSIRYPAGYTLDDTYTYTGLGPVQTIKGTKFTIDPAIATGTNLSEDSYVSVEEIAGVNQCTADKFLDLSNGGTAVDLKDGGTDYSFASTTGAGAGNRYEESVYAIPGTQPCVAVRYFVHYGVLENYPAGKVSAFDRQALLGQFDKIRRTLTLAQ
jgi:membrane-bound inhibitor of C-type lysozyme